MAKAQRCLLIHYFMLRCSLLKCCGFFQRVGSCNFSTMASSGGEMTPDQQRCANLAFRCFTGFSRKDKEKKNPIQEEKALQEWNELLDKRFPQRNSGGKPFVLKIVRIVKNRKTDEGLDLSDKPTILERLAKWSKDMCNKHNIDPGSEGMQALEQQLSWHEEQMNGHALSHESLERIETGLDQLNQKLDAKAKAKAKAKD